MITGEEPVYPDRYEQFGQGLTIRQLALKDFMCALAPCMMGVGKTIEYAEELTTAYINQLNKVKTLIPEEKVYQELEILKRIVSEKDSEIASLQKEAERLKEIIHITWNLQYPNPEYVQDLYEQFKQNNKL